MLKVQFITSFQHLFTNILNISSMYMNIHGEVEDVSTYYLHILYGFHHRFFQLLFYFIVRCSFIFYWFSIFEHLFFYHLISSGHMNINHVNWCTNNFYLVYKFVFYSFYLCPWTWFTFRQTLNSLSICDSLPHKYDKGSLMVLEVYQPTQYLQQQLYNGFLCLF